MNPERKPTPGDLIFNPSGFHRDDVPWFLVLGYAERAKLRMLIIGHLGIGEHGWQLPVNRITTINPVSVWPQGHLRYKEDWPSGMF